MATAPFNIDETLPGDTDVVSQHPSNARTFRDVVESYLNTDHDSTTGHHKYAALVEQGSDPSNVANTGFVYTKDVGGATELHYLDDSGNVVQMTSGGVSGFESGTKMVFAQASAPAGWTQDNTWNDRVLRVVDNTGTGAATGGSWTISGLTVDGHTLTAAESGVPAHTHAHAHLNNDVAGGQSGPLYGNDNTSVRDDPTQGVTGGAQNASQAHDHGLSADGDWRPEHLDVIVATKD